jgi:hypothetical protein
VPSVHDPPDPTLFFYPLHLRRSHCIAYPGSGKDGYTRVGGFGVRIGLHSIAYPAGEDSLVHWLGALGIH